MIQARGNCTPKERTFPITKSPACVGCSSMCHRAHYHSLRTLCLPNLSLCCRAPLGSASTAVERPGLCPKPASTPYRGFESHSFGLRLLVSTQWKAAQSGVCLHLVQLICLCLVFVVKQKHSSCSYFSSFNSPATEEVSPTATAQQHQSVGCFTLFKKWDEEESLHLSCLFFLHSSCFLMDREIKYRVRIPTAAVGPGTWTRLSQGKADSDSSLLFAVCVRVSGQDLEVCWLGPPHLQSRQGKGRHTGIGKTLERECRSPWHSEKVVGASHSVTADERHQFPLGSRQLCLPTAGNMLWAWHQSRKKGTSQSTHCSQEWALIFPGLLGSCRLSFALCCTGSGVRVWCSVMVLRSWAAGLPPVRL